MPSLIITNGDIAGETLRETGRADAILPWRDVLHEGPITTTDLNALTWMRVSYLAQRFGLTEAEVAGEFTARDAVMRRHADFDRIELWFEHDLYDQLQLIQVLAFFAAEARTGGITLVQADDFLGAQTAKTILRFTRHARPVSQADVDLAATVWAELASPTPEAIATRVARGGQTPLPFLLPALRRFLQELPSPGNGLGRAEQTILDLIADGTSAPRELFPAALREEEAAFMGDSSFFGLIEDMAACAVPLIEGLPPKTDTDADATRFRGAELALTMVGEDVREGGEDHVALSGVDRWWAGTRLAGHDVWRWDGASMRLVPPKESAA